MSITLNDTQRTILTAAAARDDLSVMPLPTTLRAPPAAVTRTISALIDRGLLAEVPAGTDKAVWRRGESEGDIALVATPAGLAEIGIEAAKPQGTSAGKKVSTKRKPKADRAMKPDEPKVTKQDTVLTLLRRQEGASIAEICAATGWQSHSARGFMSGALKKHLGIALISEREGAGMRRYFVAPIKSAK